MARVKNIDKLEENLMNYVMNLQEDYANSLWNGQIVLIGDDLDLGKQIVDLVSGIGGRIGNPLKIGFDNSDIEKKLNSIAVVFVVSNWDDRTRRSLSAAEEFSRGKDLPMLVLLTLNLLDEALGYLDSSNVEFLMTDEPAKLSAELIVTLNSRIEETMSSTFDGDDETDLVDLKKISADVDRIARVLSQLSVEKTGVLTRDLIPNRLIEPQKMEVEPETPPSVSDAPFNFKSEGEQELTPFGIIPEAQTETSGSTTPRQIRNLIKARRLRDQYFDSELFADPAWDMLLDLMAARLEDTKVSVSSLCIAASVPPTTALRWIKTMTEEGVFNRRADEKDGRRIFIELSDEAAAGMVGFFSMIRRNNLMMI